jgi:hypothetical protein
VVNEKKSSLYSHSFRSFMFVQVNVDKLDWSRQSGKFGKQIRWSVWEAQALRTDIFLSQANGCIIQNLPLVPLTFYIRSKS